MSLRSCVYLIAKVKVRAKELDRKKLDRFETMLSDALTETYRGDYE